MRRLNTGQATHQNLGTGDRLVVEIPPPAKGSTRYLTVIRLEGLASDHELLLTESSADFQASYQLVNNGNTTRELRSENILDSEDSPVSLYLADQNSADVSWTWDLYEIEASNPVYGPVDPTPIPPGAATGLWANEADLDDLRGIDNITSWSDLENTKVRNSTRIQRAFDTTDAEIRKRLARRYILPMSGLSVDDQLILRKWSAVLASFQLYSHRGQKDSAQLGPTMRGSTVYDAEKKTVMDDIWAYQHGVRSFAAPQNSIRPIIVTQGDYADYRVIAPLVWVY